MKFPIAFLFGFLAVSAQAANPAFTSFNTDHFGTNGTTLISIKSGALLTNVTFQGPVTSTNLTAIINAVSNALSSGASGVFSNGIASYRSNLVAATAISISASPSLFTNSLGVNVIVYVDGISVTGTVGINGTALFGTIGQNTLILGPGEYTTITYTIGTPTAKWKPF